MYVDETKFDEERLVIDGGTNWELDARLTMPRVSGGEKVAGVVLIHGSGPHDMDETVAFDGLVMKPFKDLAWGLSSKGVAVLRFEKRTKAHPMKFMQIKGMTVWDLSVEDALKAVEMLRADDRIDGERIYVVGHSYGGYLGPRVLERDTRVAGLVSLMGNVQPIEKVMLRQVRDLMMADGRLDDKEGKNLARLEAACKKIEGGDYEAGDSIELGRAKYPGCYFKDLEGYNPAKLMRRLGRPILCIGGGKDFNVQRNDFDMWKAEMEGVGRSEFKWYEDLNHGLRVEPRFGVMGKSEVYEHVAEGVINDVMEFVNEK